MLCTTLASFRGLPAIAGVDLFGRKNLGIEYRSSSCAQAGLTGGAGRSRFAQSRAAQPVGRRRQGAAFA